MRQRQSNFELLRILAIFCIICFHYALKGGAGAFIYSEFNVDKFVVKLFSCLGEFGVNIFMLLTGYFMIKSKMKAKRFIKLWMQSLFYTLFSVIILMKLGQYQITDVVGLIKIVFPDLFGIYWYVTAYLLIYLFSPYLNILFNALTMKQYKRFITLGVIVWCVIPVAFWLLNGTTETALLYYSRFIWLIVVYAIGGYIRLYPERFSTSKIKPTLLALASFVGMGALIVVSEKNPILFKTIAGQQPNFWPPNTVLMLLLSVSTFLAFKNITIPYSKFINTISGTSLGIYMLHDGLLGPLVRSQAESHAIKTPILAINIILVGLLIFVVGIVIELLRQLFMKLTIDKLIDLSIVSIFTAKLRRGIDILEDKIL